MARLPTRSPGRVRYINITTSGIYEAGTGVIYPNKTTPNWHLSKDDGSVPSVSGVSACRRYPTQGVVSLARTGAPS